MTRQTNHLSVPEVPSPPSLEASLDTTLGSSSSDDPFDIPRSSSTTVIAKPQQAVDDASQSPVAAPMDVGCVSDSLVRFFCPFETPCPSSQLDGKATHQAALETDPQCHTQQQQSFLVSNYSGVLATNHDCAAGTWLRSVEACIPDKWENSPERVNLKITKAKIRNRCSTLEANERKSEYINSIRKQWHSRDSPIPLRYSRSEAPKQKPLHKAMVPLTPSIYYDSDPDVQAESPRYKCNRPPSLNLNASEDDDTIACDFECPRVPRHSSQELQSFFESPRSVTDTPDLHNDEEVKAFIQVASEQKYKLIWHQALACHANKDPKKQTLGPHPMSVTGWFEYGSQLDNHIVFPKFVWRQTRQSGFRDISRVPKCIQLLTIVCVVMPATLDKTLYPFARLDRSCYIRTHDGQELVFEAHSRQHRDLFAKRMKVLVARLASSVIIHDEAMLQEFFVPNGSESFADYDDEESSSADCCNRRAQKSEQVTATQQPMLGVSLPGI